MLVFARPGGKSLSAEFRILLPAARYYYIGQFTRGPLRRPLFFLKTTCTDRVAVFVDAGYVFAQGTQELLGEKVRRKEVMLNAAVVIDRLREFAKSCSKLDLLRIYWYDGAATGPTSQHIALTELPDVKIRLGLINAYGEQKGWPRRMR